MKINIATFFAFFTLFACNFANAQYSNGRNYGLDRTIDANNRRSTPKKNKPVDFVKASTENMVRELNLDGFQEAIVKTIFEDYKNAVTNINDEQIPDQGKYEKMQIEIDKLDKKIEDVLTKEQKVKFATFKKKNKKKKTDEKEETEKEETESQEK